MEGMDDAVYEAVGTRRNSWGWNAGVEVRKGMVGDVEVRLVAVGDSFKTGVEVGRGGVVGAGELQCGFVEECFLGGCSSVADATDLLR
jgi:hypothetical protein